MLVRRTEPFRNLNLFRRQVDDLFNRNLVSFFEGADNSETLASWAPAMDVIETEDAVLLRAELPGLTEQDVEITLENNTLSIRGEKKFEHTEDEGHYRRIESRYGTFYRSFSLPTKVDQDKIDAHFTNGVLEVTLPKSEQAKAKRIAVKVH